MNSDEGLPHGGNGFGDGQIQRRYVVFKCFKLHMAGNGAHLPLGLDITPPLRSLPAIIFLLCCATHLRRSLGHCRSAVGSFVLATVGAGIFPSGLGGCCYAAGDRCASRRVGVGARGGAELPLHGREGVFDR